MPSAIASDGCVAPGASLPAHSLQSRITERWDRFEATKARARAAVVATISFWTAAAVTWSQLCDHVYRTDAGLGWDLVTMWRAEVVFAHGGQPYFRAATANRLFLYPPSSLLVMRPIAWLSLHEVQLGGLMATAAVTWAAVMISAAAIGRKWWGLTAAVVVFGLRWAQPLVAELGLENVTVLCFLALALFYIFTVHDHWVAAGAAIGLSMSIKPLLLPVLVVFLLARRWRGLGMAIAIPAALNLAAFAVVKKPTEVFSKLPSLLNRSGSGAVLNSAWVDVARTFGISHPLRILLQVATVGVALVGLWWAWRYIEDAAVRLITASSICLIGVYLAGTLSENHFMLTLVPLAMTAVLAKSPMRFFPAWIGILLLMGLTPPASMLGIDTQANLSAFRAFGMSLVLLAIVAVLARSHLTRRSHLKREGTATATEAGLDPEMASAERLAT